MAGQQRIFHKGRRVAAGIATAVSLAAASACGTLTYKPNYVPIVVSVNEKGDLSVRYDGELVTPIGTFTLDIAPGYGIDEGDVLLEIRHDKDGVHVKSLFLVHEIGSDNVEMTVSGGSGVRKSGDQEKTTIEIPPDAGPQEFTLEAADEEAVEVPETTSVTEWTEPVPTTTPPEPTETSAGTESSETDETESSEPETTDESVSAELPPVEVTPTG